MRIDLPLVQTEVCEITSVTHQYLILDPLKFIYSANYWADEFINIDDKELGKHNVLTDFHVEMKKEIIVGVEKVYIIPPHKLWKINILIQQGMNNNIHFFFDKKKECQKIFDELTNYIF